MKKALVSLMILVLVVGICFAEDFVTLSVYENLSSVGVNSQNASTLISRVNRLLTAIDASGVTLTGAARNWGDADLHPKSRALDLRWNQSLYNDIVANIDGSGLRVECIECIRILHQRDPSTNQDHIHLDIGRTNNDATGRLFHAINH
jgi:hypothetical protein